MRASTSFVLVCVCSWAIAAFAYDYGQTYQQTTQDNTADRRSDGLVVIDRMNQPGDNPSQPGPYEPPAYHEETPRYDASELDPFSERNAGPSQWAAMNGQASPYQDENASPYQTPEDIAAMKAQSAAAAPAQEAAPATQESAPATQQADAFAQQAAPVSQEPAAAPAQVAVPAEEASPYQTPQDIAQQREQESGATAQADPATATAAQPQAPATPQADQTSAPATENPYLQPPATADAATTQAASLQTPYNTQQTPSADQTPQPQAASNDGAASPATDQAAYPATQQLMNDEQTISTMPSEKPAEETQEPKKEETEKQQDATVQTKNIQFQLNNVGLAQMPMVDSNPGIRYMPPNLQDKVFQQIGVNPAEPAPAAKEEPAAADQAAASTEAVKPAETEGVQTIPVQEQQPAQAPAVQDAPSATPPVVQEQQPAEAPASTVQVQSVQQADKEQPKGASKGHVLNYTLRVKPEHKGQAEVQDIAFFPSDSSNGKPLLVLKQNVTRPIVENIEITLPKQHTGKPIIKVFRDGTPEAQALESGKPVVQEAPKETQQTMPAPAAQAPPQDQFYTPQTAPQAPQEQPVPWKKAEDEKKQKDEKEKDGLQKDKKKKYYDSEGNEIPPPPYDDYPGTMEDLKQSFEEVPIPYHDNPACISYTPQHCGNVWTQRNCPHLCKIKMFQASKKPVVLGELPCFDYDECKRYPVSLCDPKFGHFWVRNHCRKMCGICKKSSLLCYDRAKCKVFQISDCTNEFVKYTCPKKCSACAAGLAIWRTEKVYGFPYKKSAIAKKIHKHKRHAHKSHHKRTRRYTLPLPDIKGPCVDKTECGTYPGKFCHHSWMRRNCPEMCGVCVEIEKQKKKDEEEKTNFCSKPDHSDCARYHDNRCHESWLNENCKQMCGLCPNTSVETPASAPVMPVTAAYTSPAAPPPAPQAPAPAPMYGQSQYSSYYGKRSIDEDLGY